MLVYCIPLPNKLTQIVYTKHTCMMLNRKPKLDIDERNLLEPGELKFLSRFDSVLDTNNLLT